MSNKKTAGRLLEQMTWIEAEQCLTADTVVVIPLGAAAKEHGPHLPLNNDFVIAQYFRDRLLARMNVVAVPTVSYHFYPAFAEYPGSISLRLETGRDLIVDLCRSLRQFGPKRFYVLNTGVSTTKALRPAAETLLNDDVILRFSDWKKMLSSFVEQVEEQEGGGHADEIETSIMLYIAPHLVDMSKTVKDYSKGDGFLTRKADSAGVYSPSGIWGDPTLATVEKGAKITEHMVAWLAADLEKLQSVPT